MSVNLAVYGDIHGNVDLMYNHAISLSDIDVVLQVGDFTPIRRDEDFAHYFAPRRHDLPGDFVDYFEGKKEAPFLTLFIGGNHEPWGVLAEHKDGGFLVPNIFYLGRSGVVDVRGVRIAGLTGLYDPNHYRLPLSTDCSDSWKYYREDEVKKLEGEEFDILLLHDWAKPLSQMEVLQGQGLDAVSRQSIPTPTFNLIERVQPELVFMGHEHNSHLEVTLGESQIIGLSQFDERMNTTSFRVIRK